MSYSALPDSLDGEALPSQPTPGKSLLREIIETVLLTVLIYVAVNFATGRFRIEGSSMEPSMHPNQYVLVDKLSYMLGDPKRGDVVVFNFPQATERDFIKRVIGLPGETVAVRGGVVYVNDVALDEPYISAPPAYENSWTLAPDQFFVLGDNRNSSSDSHTWGPLDRGYLIGRAILIYWPPNLWGTVPHYTYAAAPSTSLAEPTGAALPTSEVPPAGYPEYPTPAPEISTAYPAYP